jgi:enamine deaminase RidA (YjgF/YER057c/UK114 family)
MIDKYLIFRPEKSGNPGEEWRQCLKQIIYKRETGFRLIKLNVFANLPDYETYIKVSREIGKTIQNAFGNECPVFNITVHPPEEPWKITVEAGYADSVSCDITTNFWNSIPYVVCTSDSGKEIWAGGLGLGLFPLDTRKAAEAGFEQMRTVLHSEGMSFDHLVRQWNYIGNILETKNEYQNYQVFNEVRNEYYQKYRTIHGYPAATGIGMKLGGVTYDFCAVMSDSDVTVKSIDNPNQVNAYEYGQQVLKGISAEGKPVKHAPQFERALLLAGKKRSTLFISGTASIIGQDTIGIEDVEKQTVVTIDNINKLIDQKRIWQMTGSSDSKEENMLLLRVYVKNQKDFEKVKSVCNERFPGIPAVFIESDICRDDLLVEIEAELQIHN